MPHYHYDTPNLSPRLNACRDQQTEYRYRDSTEAAARQVCESTTAYGLETSSMEVEEIQSRSASVVHRNGQNMCGSDDCCGSRLDRVFLDRRAQTTPVPPGAEAFTAGPVDVPTTASAAAVRITVPVRADVTATAPDDEALTAELLVCGDPECENQPCLAEPGQTTVLSHPLLPAWSVAAKTRNRFYHTPYYRTPDCREYGSNTRL